MNAKKMLLVVVLLALQVLASVPSTAQDLNDEVLALAAEVERLAEEQDVWPGFEPMTIPLAVYDGDHTYLFRHDAPPKGFHLHDDVYRFEGRYPTVVANTPAEIEEVLASGMMIDRRQPDQTLTDLAAVALHEAFHVHQRTHHPGWVANEADLFVYPVEDAELLTLHRLETRALRRALASEPDDRAGCWARAALDLRDERYAVMDSAFVAYERYTEHIEGLALYLEYRYAARPVNALLDADREAEEVRLRSYATGAALATLLDRFHPEWKRALAGDDEQYLEGMLLDAPGLGAIDSSCTFEEEVDDVQRRARHDVAQLLEERTARRRAFEERPGWRVVIEASDADPLRLQGFDPMNVRRVDGGVLHTRWLRLGNEAGEMEAMAGDTTEVELLTVGAGEHPLFEGVQEVVFTGLPKSAVGEREGVVALEGAGITATFQDAGVERGDREIRIRIGLN